MDAEPDADHLSQLFTYSLDMLGVSVDGHLLHVNPAWTRLLGSSADELTAGRFSAHVHPDDVESTERILAELGPQMPTRTFRNRMRTTKGDYLVVNWSVRKVDGQCYLTAHDVSAEAEMRKRAELSEAMSTAVLHTAVDAIIVIDTTGTIIDANHATSTLFGYEPGALIGRGVEQLMPEPFRSEHAGYISRYLAEGDPRIIGIGREVAGERSDGTVFPIHLSVSEVLTDHDHLFTGIIHDLTERNRQRDELQQANAALEERVTERTAQLEQLLDDLRRSNHDLEQFAYIASHDLQAPLRNVRQGLELLDEHLDETIGTAFDDEARELRDLVVAAVLRMEELIKGLLEYSRVQRAEARAEKIDLDDVVAEVAAMLSPDIGSVDGRLEIGELPEILGNPTQMRQVFQNLIANSVRYRSEDRALEVTVEAVPSSPDGYVTVAVRDNGTGIDPAHHERIFELFRRGHSGYDGVGLGLAICKRIVEGHRGRIRVESTPGNGATFLIELPAPAA